jgi:hypothetical protein
VALEQVASSRPIRATEYMHLPKQSFVRRKCTMARIRSFRRHSESTRKSGFYPLKSVPLPASVHTSEHSRVLQTQTVSTSASE